MTMKIRSLLILIISLCNISFPAIAQPADHDTATASNEKWKLVWSDEFNYKGLPDSTKWSYATGRNGWGNNELQNYTYANPANVNVHDGNLYVTTRKQNSNTDPYTSARLVSKNKGDWTYGKIEARVILPKGRGLWPSVWMLPTDWKYGGWPSSGEIDIFENVGYNRDTVFGTVHTKAYNHIIGTQKGSKIFVEEPNSKFHVYGVEWTPELITFLMDGKPYYHFSNEHKTSAEWPFDQRFHLLINIAVGGNWGGKFGVDDNIFPATMRVDYVRVFQKQ